MTKILRPVDASIHKPEPVHDNEMLKDLKLSAAVIVRFINKKVSETYSALSFAYYNHSEKIWKNANPGENCLHDIDLANQNNEVVEWYEGIEIESLFPDDDHSAFVATQASNGSFQKQLSHQEGQTFNQNHILKQLKK
jgi:hypothetical protein